ncbi:MAG: thioredoxin [Lentihominibacter sp.]|jgi:thioredoxin 1
MVKKFNNQNFAKEVLENDDTVLVDFYADWCGPCRMVSPIVEDIANERTDISVGKLNVDESSAIAAQYNVMSIPTLIVFKGGKESARLVGYRPKDAILAEL